MTEIETIVLGVVSGILTTSVLYLIGLVFKNHIIPWYQGVTYKGVDINGTWVANLEVDNIKAKLEMTIRQRAHFLRGDTTLIQGKDLNKPSSIVNMEMKGGVWEGFVTLNMQSKDRSRLSYSTSLLQVVNGGAALKGSYVWRSIRSDEISSQDITWTRKN